MFRRDTGEILPYTKTDDGDRYIFLQPEAVKVIEAAKAYQQAKGYDAEGYIFAINGNVFKDRIVNTLLQKYAKQLGISYRSSHKARKSYGSVCIDGGVGIDTVRQMLGHSDERTTLNYYCYDTDLDQERKAKLKKAVDFTNFTQCPQSVPRKF